MNTVFGSRIIASYFETDLRDLYFHKWDIEGQNNVIKNQDEMGWCLTDVSDEVFRGRRLRFRRKG